VSPLGVEKQLFKILEINIEEFRKIK